MARQGTPKRPDEVAIQPPPPEAPAPAVAAEKRQLLQRIWDKDNAEIAGFYIDLVLRLAMCIALLVMSWRWLEKVGEVIEKQSDKTRQPLSDAVVIALLTTTTATVLGLLLIVVNYLFPKRLSDLRPPQATAG